MWREGRLVVQIAMLGVVVAPAAVAAERTRPETEEEKVAYAFGVAASPSFRRMNLSEDELAMAQQGLADAVLGRELFVDMQVYVPKVRALLDERHEAGAAAEKQASLAFLEQEAAKAGAVTLASGLIITEIEPGAGDSPTEESAVRIHYTGFLRDGTVFASTREQGEPKETTLGEAIPCWAEGLSQMKEGGTSRLVCPAETAYGENGAPPRVPASAAIAFEMQLVEIVH